MTDKTLHLMTAALCLCEACGVEQTAVALISAGLSLLAIAVRR